MGNVSKNCSFGFIVAFFLSISYHIFLLNSMYAIYEDWNDFFQYGGSQDALILFVEDVLILSLSIFCYLFARVLNDES